MNVNTWLLVGVLLIIVLDIIFRFKQTDYPLLQKALNQPNDYGVSLQLRTLMSDKTPYAQIGADENGKILMWNLRAEETFGWKESEMLGKNLRMIIPEQFRGMHDAGIERWRKTGESRIIDNKDGVQLVGLHRLGSEFPIHLKLVSINDKGYKLIGGYIRNISRDLDEREKLLKALKFCRSVLDTAKIGGFIWNIDTNKVLLDQNAVKIYNVDIEDIDTYTAPELIDLIYPKDQAKVSLTVNEAIEKKLPFYELYYRRMQDDGSLRWIYSKGCTSMDDKDEIFEINGIIEDLGPANPIDDDYKEHIHYG